MAAQSPVRMPARESSYKVDVYLAPKPMDRQRGEKPKPMEGFVVTAPSPATAREKARRELAKRHPGKPVRSFSSNTRTGGFIAYYQAEGR